jgi:hypothetical protein
MIDNTTSRARQQRMLAVSTLSLLYAASCILEDNRCGPHQVQQHGNYVLCICEPNAVAQSDGSCLACGENEEPMGKQCACKPGFARSTAAGTCEKSEIGAMCSASASCSPSYPVCLIEGTSAGYCTSTGCTNNASCPAGFSCEVSGAMRVCKKLPVGLNAKCESSADCANYAATYCDTFMSKSCQLQSCASGENKCPSEWGCCDYTMLIGASICVPPDTLTNGACPAGARLVPQ